LPPFAFDDEPLDQILYGKKLGGPTSAGLYLPALEYVQGIGHALRNGKIEDAVEQASALREKGYAISAAMCLELASIMRDLVPDYVNPVMELDLSGLGPLVDMMWDMAMKCGDKIIQNAAGAPIYRWYEHHQRYEDARNVLGGLIRICHEQNERVGEAVLINNFAFEYLLEGKFRESMPLFRKAADMFQEEGDVFEHANARANYLECRFEFEFKDFEGTEEIEKELKTLFPILRKGGGRKIRKLLILLAKMEEQKGNTAKAVKLVERAIKAGEKSHTRYPEIDAEYLGRLKSQME
jgi:tetratricopeptide (TPR) repeat protein